MPVGPVEDRRIRLKNDYETMENIRTPWLTWRATKGTSPYVEQYEIEIRLKTITDPRPSYHDQHLVRVTLGPDYPLTAAPLTEMVSRPAPFHPNWFTDGRWCPGPWLVYEMLGAHVVRMIQTLQYDEEITNPGSPANAKAKDWYLGHRNRGLFPCDRTPLPDPTTRPRKKKFVVR